MNLIRVGEKDRQVQGNEKALKFSYTWPTEFRAAHYISLASRPVCKVSLGFMSQVTFLPSHESSSANKSSVG